MNFCHGDGEERDEFESVSHLMRAGKSVKTVPYCSLFLPVLGGVEELLAPHGNPTALQELTLSHGAKPATVGGDLRKSF